MDDENNRLFFKKAARSVPKNCCASFFSPKKFGVMLLATATSHKDTPTIMQEGRHVTAKMMLRLT